MSQRQVSALTMEIQEMLETMRGAARGQSASHTPATAEGGGATTGAWRAFGAGASAGSSSRAGEASAGGSGGLPPAAFRFFSERCVRPFGGRDDGGQRDGG